MQITPTTSLLSALSSVSPRPTGATPATPPSATPPPAAKPPASAPEISEFGRAVLEAVGIPEKAAAAAPPAPDKTADPAPSPPANPSAPRGSLVDLRV